MKAEVATIEIGLYKFEGLKLENGQYAIAQQQIAQLFQIVPSSAPKWLKSLLEGGFQLFQVKTNREKQAGKQNRPENALSLLDFKKLIRKLDKQGNVIAEQIAESMLEMALEQRFADAFLIALTAGDRQEILSISQLVIMVQDMTAEQLEALITRSGVKALPTPEERQQYCYPVGDRRHISCDPLKAFVLSGEADAFLAAKRNPPADTPERRANLREMAKCPAVPDGLNLLRIYS